MVKIIHEKSIEELVKKSESLREMTPKKFGEIQPIPTYFLVGEKYLVNSKENIISITDEKNLPGAKKLAETYELKTGNEWSIKY